MSLPINDHDIDVLNTPTDMFRDMLVTSLENEIDTLSERQNSQRQYLQNTITALKNDSLIELADLANAPSKFKEYIKNLHLPKALIKAFDSKLFQGQDSSRRGFERLLTTCYATGYTLHSEYTSPIDELLLECPHGEVLVTNARRFTSGHRCKCCSTLTHAQNKAEADNTLLYITQPRATSMLNVFDLNISC